jgi:hypothetical protein
VISFTSDISDLTVDTLLSKENSYGYISLQEPSICLEETSKVITERSTTNSSDTVAEPSQFVFKANSDFIVTWDSIPNYMVININAATLGWVSFGVSAMGQMSSGDFCTGWIDDETGDITLLDTWSPNKSMLTVTMRRLYWRFYRNTVAGS